MGGNLTILGVSYGSARIFSVRKRMKLDTRSLLFLDIDELEFESQQFLEEIISAANAKKFAVHKLHAPKLDTSCFPTPYHRDVEEYLQKCDQFIKVLDVLSRFRTEDTYFKDSLLVTRPEFVEVFASLASDFHVPHSAQNTEAYRPEVLYWHELAQNPLSQRRLKREWIDKANLTIFYRAGIPIDSKEDLERTLAETADEVFKRDTFKQYSSPLVQPCPGDYVDVSDEDRQKLIDYFNARNGIRRHLEKYSILSSSSR